MFMLAAQPGGKGGNSLASMSDEVESLYESQTSLAGVSCTVKSLLF